MEPLFTSTSDASRQKQIGECVKNLSLLSFDASHLSGFRCSRACKERGFRDRDAAVFVLVVFEDRSQRTANSQAGAVQRVHEAHFAVGVTETQIGAAALEIEEVGAAGDLTIFAVAWQPDFEVVSLGGAETDVAGRQADDAVCSSSAWRISSAFCVRLSSSSQL